MLKKILKLNLVILLAVLFFTSCKKDNLTLDENPAIIETPTTNNNLTQIQSLISSDSSGCYEIVFPITFINDDGTTSTANTETDLEAIFTNAPFPVNIEFPINLEDPATGQTATANNENELTDLLADCVSYPSDPTLCDSTNIDFGSLGCYELVYPLSFVLTDGTIVTAQSNDDLQGIFTSNNPPIEFSYPINLVSLIDGSSHTANSEEELGTLLSVCDGITIDPPVIDTTIINFGFLGCYDLVYPVSFLLTDGTTATANNENDLNTIFSSTTNPTVGFVYPINLVSLIDSTSAVANSEEDLGNLLSDCDGFGGGNWNAGVVFGLTCVSIPSSPTQPVCYTYNYPITVTLDGGGTATANDDNEMMSIIFGSPALDFVYPIALTDNDSGATLTANNADEVLTLIADCD